MMVNFDGVAIATIIFQYHSTILSFLECLESGLLPKGCLQPPLFYLKTHHRTQRKDKSDPDLSDRIITTQPLSVKKSNSNSQSKSASPDPSVAVPHSSAEVTNASDNSTCHIWNQVFAVRCGSHPVVTPQLANGKKSSILMGEIPGKFLDIRDKLQSQYKIDIYYIYNYLLMGSMKYAYNGSTCLLRYKLI